MHTIVLILHILIAFALIGLILIQQGKGADAGSGFGAGSSGTVFGARGSASFLSRMTAALAAVFFVTSMVLGYFATQPQGPTSVIQNGPPAPVSQQSAPKQQKVTPPVKPAAPAQPAQAPSDVPKVPQQ